MGTENGDVELARCQREDPVVLRQHDRASSQFLGQFAALLGCGLDVDPLGRVGMFEEPHLELRPQHAPDTTIDVPDVHCAPFNLGREHVPVPVRIGHLDIQARLDGESASVSRISGHSLPVDELIDGGVVGGDEAVEPEGVAQQVLHGRGVQAFRAAGSPGEIGIVLDIWKREPATQAAADVALAQQGEDDGFRFFLDALRGGGYSPRLRARLEAEGMMPDVRDGDQAVIEEPIDYLGLNVYSRVVVDAAKHDPEQWAQSNPQPGGNFLDNGLEFYPRAVYEALHMVRDDYGWTGPVYITENGCSDGPSAEANPLDDDERIAYVSGFLEWIAIAAREGFDVRGYYLWSLMDNYEWSLGFSRKYGIARVDPQTLERIPKKSATWYADVIAAHRARHGAPPTGEK